MYTPPHKWYKMALDHCDEQYNAWKLGLMYKIKNIERCQFYCRWFVEMGIQMFLGIRIGIYKHIQFSKKSYSECPLPVTCLSMSFWTWGPKYIYSELTQKKSDGNKNPQKPPVGEQASSSTIEHDFTTAEIQSLFQIYSLINIVLMIQFFHLWVIQVAHLLKGSSACKPGIFDTYGKSILNCVI